MKEKKTIQSFYIKKLFLKNFKKFERAEIQFEKGLNFLIGPNNAGKSTILEAIDIVIGGTWLTEENIDNSFFLEGKREFMIRAEIEFPEIGSSSNPNRINFIRNLKCAKGSGRSVINGNFTNAFWKDEFELIEKGKDSYDPLGESNIEIDKIYFILSAEMTDDGGYSIENYIWLDFKKSVLKGFDMVSYNSVKIQVGRQMRSNLISFLFIPAARSENRQLFHIAPYTWFGKYLRNLQKNISSEVRDFFEETKSKIFPVQPGTNAQIIFNDIFGEKGKLSINSFDSVHEDTLFKYAHLFLEDPFYAEIDKKGHGIQSAAAIALFSDLLEWESKALPSYSTPQTGAADSHWATILEIEEPESHFHPPVRSRLISLLKKRFVNSGAQIILSTHDEGFVRWPYANGSNFIFPSAVDDQYKIRAFNFLDNEYDGSNGISSRILRFQAQTVFSEKVLIVEGCEAVCLDAILARIFNENFSDNYIVIAQSVSSKPRSDLGDRGNVQPGGGASQIPDIVDLYEQLGIKRACLIDIDCLFNGMINGIIESFGGNLGEFDFSRLLSASETKNVDGSSISAQEMRSKIKSDEEKERLLKSYLSKLSGMGIFVYDKGDFEGNFKGEFVREYTKANNKVIKEGLVYALKTEAEMNDNFKNICLRPGAEEDMRNLLSKCRDFFDK
ncbi:ATP-dependent endonuclease [Patescibacteria group bacterium]